MQSFAAKEHHSPGLFSLDRHAAKLVLLEMFLCPDTRESGIAGRLSNRFWRRCLQYAHQHIGKTRQGWNKVAYKRSGRRAESLLVDFKSETQGLHPADVGTSMDRTNDVWSSLCPRFIHQRPIQTWAFGDLAAVVNTVM